MSQENVELVRRLSEEFSRGSVEAVRPFFHPDIAWHEGSIVSGKRASIAASTHSRSIRAGSSWSSRKSGYEVRETVDIGDDVIANMRIRGLGKTSGAGFELSAWWAFTIQDHRVVRCFAYLDRNRALEALEAAGSAE